jgi:hypothetical protein
VSGLGAKFPGLRFALDRAVGALAAGEVHPDAEKHAGIAAKPLLELAGGHLSDDDVARVVRMLYRDDVDHEGVCTVARDRIVWLSGQLRLARQREEAEAVSTLDAKLLAGQVAALREENARLRGECRRLDSVAGGYLAEAVSLRNQLREAQTDTVRFYPGPDSGSTT